MAKILVTPTSNKIEPFEIEGRILSKKFFQNEGFIYYIGGESFPEEIVTILEGEAIENV